MDKKIENIFEENVAKGVVDEALGYGDEGQPIRLKAASAQIAEYLWGKEVFAPLTVVDVGCGFADLYPVLREEAPTFRYIGVDQIDWIAEAARDKYPEVAAHIHTGNLLTCLVPKADVTVALGILACLTPEEDDQFIQQLFNQTREQGLIVLSFPDADLYSGTFRGMTLEYVSQLIGIPLTEDLIVRTTGIHVTVAFLKSHSSKA